MLSILGGICSSILVWLVYKIAYNKGINRGVDMTIYMLDYHDIISTKELEVIVESVKNGTYKGKK